MKELGNFGRLRASYVWGDEVMSDSVLVEPGQVTLGSGAGATFTTPELGLPPGFAILRPGSRGYVLTLERQMAGRLSLGGREQNVEEFLAADSNQGAFSASAIAPGDWGVIHLDGAGEHNLFFQFVRDEPALPRARWQDSELLAPAIAFAVLVHALFIIYAMMNKPDRHSMVPPGSRDLIANYLVNKPADDAEPGVAVTVPGTDEGEETIEPDSAAGEAGKSGGGGETPRKRAPDPDKGEPNEALPRSVRRGLLSNQNVSRYEKILDRGGFDKKLGDTMARIRASANSGGPGGFGPGKGPGVGDDDGMGTITVGTDSGIGGDGDGDSDKRTSKPMNTGGVRKVKGLKDKLKEEEVTIEIDDATGDFNDRTEAQILKVVRSRQNALRMCYQRQLQHTKGLGGKLVVHWKIDPTGRVKQAAVKSSSIKNSRVEDCVIRQISNLKFPPAKKMARVKFPLIFHSGK